MDAVTLASVVSAVIDGAAGKVGEKLWDGLVALVRGPARDGDGGSKGTAEIQAVRQSGGKEDRVRALARALATRAEADEDFDAGLHEWLTQVREAGVSVDVVSNVIGDGNQIGMVFQGRFGDVTVSQESPVIVALRRIRILDPEGAFSEFRKLSPKDCQFVLCRVPLDTGAGLLTAMEERVADGAAVELLKDLNEDRLTKYLGPGGLHPPLLIDVVAALPSEKLRRVLARLAVNDPAIAAGLVEQLAAGEPAPGRHTGPDAVVEVLPADHGFLAALPASKAAVGLLASLPEGDRTESLSRLTPQVMRDSLRLAVPEHIVTLLAALPDEQAERELNQMATEHLGPLLAALSHTRQAPKANLLSCHLLAAVLADAPDETAASWLEQLNQDKAARVAGKMSPTQAAACLQLVRLSTASDLFRQQSDATGDWLADVAAALPRWLRRYLLRNAAAGRPAEATQLAARQEKDSQAGPSGWPRIDAVLTMLPAIKPALNRLSPQFRGSDKFGTALAREIVDVRKFWHEIWQAAVTSRPDYQAQRNVLAIALLLALASLACAIIIR